MPDVVVTGLEDGLVFAYCDGCGEDVVPETYAPLALPELIAAATAHRSHCRKA